jgi:DNA-binding LacI/PurR family transcriptional regulator
VSHVIRGSVPVSEALHPNHRRAQLKTSKTRTLGIIVPDMTIPFFPRVIRGAEMAARKSGYTLIIVTSDDDATVRRN